VNTLIAAVIIAGASTAYLFALSATERFTGAHHLLPIASVIIIATSVATTVAYRVAPLWWVLVWITALATATPIVLTKLTRTYPRRKIRSLLKQRLATVIGADWTKQLTIAYTPNNRATRITTSLPAALIPSDITPRLRSVLSETLSGSWTLSTQGTKITATRKVVKPDPPMLRHLKEVVYAPKAFTSTARIIGDHIADDGAIGTFSVCYGINIASDIALGPRRRSIEKQIRESLPAASGSWSFEWKVTEKTCVVTRSLLSRRIDHTLTVTPVQSMTEAAASYPNLKIGLGTDEFGELVTWKLDGDATPHGICFGATGGGKSSQIATIITEGTAAGACFIIADFKGGDEYNRFRDWPNVHLVAQDFYACLRAIAYAEELMNQRFSGGRTPAGAPSPKVPVILIIDEFAAAVEELKQVWPRLRGDNKKLPSVAPTITAVGQILRKGRSSRVHTFNATQRATADYFPAEFKHNCTLKIQAGWCDGVTSQNFWDNFDIGQTIPVKTPGRALINIADPPVQFQGFYTPNPIDQDLAVEEAEILEALRPTTALYARMLIDLPNASLITDWHQIATAPIVPADSRPDLDPLHEQFSPRETYQIDTISKFIDPNTMQLKQSPNFDPPPLHDLDEQPDPESED
jgi:hypothetical protein